MFENMHVITLLSYSFASFVCTAVGKEGVTPAPAVVTASSACNTNAEVVKTCFVCSQLPFGLRLPPQDCCTDGIAYEICKNCIAEPVKCLADYLALVNGEDPYENNKSNPNDEENRSSEHINKRFGRLFLGRRPLSRPVIYELPVTEKRTDGLDLPEEDSSDGTVLKRWGTLNMGSRYGSFNLGKLWKHYNSPYKRNGVLSDTQTNGHNTEDTYGRDYPENSLKKRYGTLYLGKRYGTLFFGKWFPDRKKKYGTFFLGKRHGLPNEEKRYGTLYLGKKWGTLGLGNTRRYVLTKRDAILSRDLDKRYGRLFL